MNHLAWRVLRKRWRRRKCRLSPAIVAGRLAAADEQHQQGSGRATADTNDT
jgi:hypothetical protein